MTRFIALLRGVNISGKNKIPMAQLKACFEQLGFADVKTYLNSGNVVFSSSLCDEQNITAQLEQMIQDGFGFKIPVFVIAKEELSDIFRHAPEWWGKENKEVYDNLIFIMPPATFEQLYDEIGAPKADLEQIMAYKETVFWSFIRKDYQKTNWWHKTASAGIADKLTIRTAGTVRKLCGL